MEQVNGLLEIRAWTVLQHVAWEGPGLIVAEAKRRGLRLDVRRLDLGAAVPKVYDVDGLVVMGGPMGVCLVLARALGARLTEQDKSAIADEMAGRRKVKIVGMGDGSHGL